MLRAQVERMNVELKEYRKRLSWVSSNGIRSQTTNNQSRNSITGAGSSDFQFQFPKFGDSPSTTIFNSTSNQRNSQPPVRTVQRTSSNPNTHTASPATSSVGRHSMSEAVQNTRSSNQNSSSNSPMNQLAASPPSYNTQPVQNSIDSLSGLFSPSILEATRNSPNGYFGIDNNNSNGNGNNQIKNVSRGSFDNSYSSVPGLYSGSSVSNTESPGSSSDSHHQLSSIGTSPEPNFNSPNNKIQDFGGLNTINEEQNFLNAQTWDCKSTFGNMLERC